MLSTDETSAVNGAVTEGATATVAEIIISQLSKLVRDDALIHIGVTTPLGYVAAALAKATHAPSARLYALNVSGYMTDPFPLTPSLNEAMALRYGPQVRITDMYTHLERHEGCDFEPVIPVQIDQFGNINLSLIGDKAKPKVRLPGVGGLDVMGVMLDPKVALYTARHSVETFVDKVDFITALGNQRDGRPRSDFVPQGSGGPGTLVSNLGVFDFEGEGGRMRVRSLHEGVDPEHVKKSTGFSVEGMDATIPTTASPTDRELDLIRNALDPLGMRDLEFLSAKERRAALRGLLTRQREFVIDDFASGGSGRARVLDVIAGGRG